MWTFVDKCIKQWRKIGQPGSGKNRICICYSTSGTYSKFQRCISKSFLIIFWGVGLWLWLVGCLGFGLVALWLWLVGSLALVGWLLGFGWVAFWLWFGLAFWLWFGLAFGFRCFFSWLFYWPPRSFPPGFHWPFLCFSQLYSLVSIPLSSWGSFAFSNISLFFIVSRAIFRLGFIGNFWVVHGSFIGSEQFCAWVSLAFSTLSCFFSMVSEQFPAWVTLACSRLVLGFLIGFRTVFCLGFIGLFLVSNLFVNGFRAALRLGFIDLLLILLIFLSFPFNILRIQGRGTG